MAARRLPPRRVRNIRFAHLRPRRRRTEKPLRPTVIDRALELYLAVARGPHVP